MSRTPLSSAARLRAHLAAAAALAALTACGPGGPKPESQNTGGNSGPAAGISLVAGNATLAGRNDAKGSSARFNTPRGIAIDSNGNLFVADELNYAIRKIAPDGTVSTFAGVLGTVRTGGNSGPAAGISLVAGNATLAGRNDAKGSSARFNTPRGIAIDSNGNLFVADELNYAIRKIAPDGTVSTFAGVLGTVRTSGTGDGNGTRALFVDPTALAIDASNNLFVLDGFAIRKITPSGDVSTLTTLPSGSGFGTSVQFQPAGIAIDGNGNLFVTTSVDLRRLSPSNSYRSSTTLESGLAFDYGLGIDVLAPRGVTVDSGNVAWFADLGNTISRVPQNSNVSLRFAGTQGTSGSNDGPGANARFGQVVALTVDKNGNLYAADALNFTVRKITSNAVTSTVAGRAGINAYGTGNLPGTLTTPRGITNDGKGNLYLTEGNAVVKITLP